MKWCQGSKGVVGCYISNVSNVRCSSVRRGRGPFGEVGCWTVVLQGAIY